MVNFIRPKFLAILLIVAAGSACAPSTEEAASNKTTSKNPSTFSILAFSWQPAFCELNRSKPECISQTATRFDASNFAIHGLWPRGAYCDVEKSLVETDKRGQWQALPELELTAKTRGQLATVMPGYQSGLHRHEWIKHGTCYGDADAQEYYADTLKIMAELNASRLRDLFANNIGKQVSRDEIKAALDASFGSGAGSRARVKCKKDGDSGRTLITEITIALAGEITPQSRLSNHLLDAKADTKQGCPGGIIDPVGLQ